MTTLNEAQAAFNDLYRESVVEIPNGVLMDYNPSLKEGKIVNQLSLPRGGHLIGGLVGVYGKRLANGNAPNVVFEHMHADWNMDGYDQIRTAPAGGRTAAQHITSNHPNGWTRSLGTKGVFLTVPTVITVCCMVDWNRSAGGQVIAYGSVWAMRFTSF